MKICKFLKKSRDASFLLLVELLKVNALSTLDDWHLITQKRVEHYVPSAADFFMHPITNSRFIYRQYRYNKLLSGGSSGVKFDIALNAVIQAYSTCIYGAELNREWMAKLLKCHYQSRIPLDDFRQFINDTIVIVSKQGEVTVSPFPQIVNWIAKIFTAASGLIFFIFTLMAASMFFEYQCVPNCAIVGAFESLSLLLVFTWAGHKIGFRCRNFTEITKLVSNL
jgi:hypothetical protein